MEAAMEQGNGGEVFSLKKKRGRPKKIQEKTNTDGAGAGIVERRQHRGGGSRRRAGGGSNSTRVVVVGRGRRKRGTKFTRKKRSYITKSNFYKNKYSKTEVPVSEKEEESPVPTITPTTTLATASLITKAVNTTTTSSTTIACGSGSGIVRVGQVVSGVVDGSFDAGFLVSVRVGDPDENGHVFRGVVFGPGMPLPLNRDIDVAPKLKRTKRSSSHAAAVAAGLHSQTDSAPPHAPWIPPPLPASAPVETAAAHRSSNCTAPASGYRNDDPLVSGMAAAAAFLRSPPPPFSAAPAPAPAPATPSNYFFLPSPNPNPSPGPDYYPHPRGYPPFPYQFLRPEFTTSPSSLMPPPPRGHHPS